MKGTGGKEKDSAWHEPFRLAGDYGVAAAGARFVLVAALPREGLTPAFGGAKRK